MAGLVPAIHVFIFVNRSKDMDARHKAEHDGETSASGRHGKRRLKKIGRLRSIKLSPL
jgi:hypothetical protein